jgi:hypothetical protein
MSASIGAFGIIIVISVALLPEIRNTGHFPFRGGSRCFVQQQKLFTAWTENVGMFVISLVAYFITLKCSFTLTGAVAVRFILDSESFKSYLKAQVRALYWRVWRHWRNFLGC